MWSYTIILLEYKTQEWPMLGGKKKDAGVGELSL